MLTDKETMFFDDEEVLESTVSSSIKVGAVGKGGYGSTMYGRLSAFVRCTETYTDLTSIELAFVESEDDDTWTEIKGAGKVTLTGDEMVAGEVDVNMPAGNSTKAYLALQATITGTPTTGKIEAGLTTGNSVG